MFSIRKAMSRWSSGGAKFIICALVLGPLILSAVELYLHGWSPSGVRHMSREFDFPALLLIAAPFVVAPRVADKSSGTLCLVICLTICAWAYYAKEMKAGAPVVGANIGLGVIMLFYPVVIIAILVALKRMNLSRFRL